MQAKIAAVGRERGIIFLKLIILIHGTWRLFIPKELRGVASQDN